MRMLGLTTEASLCGAKGHYRSGGGRDGVNVVVQPAQFPFGGGSLIKIGPSHTCIPVNVRHCFPDPVTHRTICFTVPGVLCF